MKCPNCNHEEPIFREDGKMVACMDHKTEDAVNKVCRECGSTDVYWDAYVNVNDPEDVRTFNNVFCDNCEGETSLTTEPRLV